MTILERAQQKLTEIGYTQEQIVKLQELLAYDLVDRIMADYEASSAQANPAEFDALVQESEALKENPQGLSAYLEKVADKAYGADRDNKLQSILAEELMKIHDQTLSLREKMDKIQANDPTAVAELEALKNDPAVQEELARIQALGVDAEKEVASTAQGGTGPNL